MKKRIILGSILSVFMLVSVTWIIPVTVKAYETEGKKILKDLNDFSKSLSEDSDFEQLMDLHSSQKIEHIFKQVLNAEDKNQINNLANQYKNFFTENELNQIAQITDRLNEKYGDDFKKLTCDITNLYNSNSGNYDENIEDYYYKITENKIALKVVKQENEETLENIVLVRGSDGAIKISGGEWIDQGALDKLKEFLNILAMGGIVGSYIGIYVGMLGLAIAEIGFEKIGYLIFRFGMRFGIFALFTSIYSYVILMLIDIFEKLIENKVSKQKNKIVQLTNDLKYKREKLLFFQRIIEKIVIYLQNINANLN